MTVVEMLSGLWDLLSRPLSLGGRTLPFSILTIVAEFVLPLVAVVLVLRVLRYAGRRAVERWELSENAESGLRKWGRIGSRVFFWVTAAILTARILGAEMFVYIGAVIEFLNQPFYESGGTEVSVVTLILLIPIAYVASVAARTARGAVDRSLLERLSIDPSRRFSISSLVRYAVMAIVFVIGLSLIGINLSSLAVLFGVLGIGLGFGLQGVVANFFAGLVIIITRPIKEGDRIQVEGFEGDVIRIRLLTSVINTVTNETIVVPNSDIVQNKVHNYSYEDRTIILVNDVQVAYSSDLDEVRTVLLSVGAKNPYRVHSKEAFVLFRSFDDSGITVSLRTWISAAELKQAAHSWCNLEIWRAFRLAGIEIPFPQLDLHLKSDSRSHDADGD
jgi:small-conductance mechanosensitive channel